MSDVPPGSGTDGVEEGKRLIRVGGDRGLSLADRIAERFQRLTWRTPIHTMRLRGRHPLKLIAVAAEADQPLAFLDSVGRRRGKRIAHPPRSAAILSA